MNEGKTFIRASSLPGYVDCPRRAAANLFRKEIEAAGYDLRVTPFGIGASIGTGVHAGAAYTLAEKAKDGRPAPLDAVTDCAVSTFRDEVAKGVEFDKSTPDPNTAEQQVVRMTQTYQTVLAPQINPIAIEERLEAETEFGIVLTGQSDVLAREQTCLRDLKTGARRGNYKPQLGAYSLLIRSNGINVEKCVEDHLQRAPLKKPQPDPLSHEHDIGAAETAAINVLAHIARDVKTFREGDPELGILPGDPWAFLANPNSMLCSPKYCKAFNTPWCIEHKRKDDE